MSTSITCPRDGIGRHNGLKIRGTLVLAGSTPAAGTIFIVISLNRFCLFELIN